MKRKKRQQSEFMKHVGKEIVCLGRSYIFNIFNFSQRCFFNEGGVQGHHEPLEMFLSRKSFRVTKEPP